jgi:hypothetical protein
MAQGARTQCRLTVGKSSVEISVTRPDGGSAGRKLGAFNAAEVVGKLASLALNNDAAITAYGQALFDQLFSDADVKSAFVQAEQQVPSAEVQVCIEIQDKLAPELRNLRWEALCDQTLPNPRRLAVHKPFRLIRRLGSVEVVNRQPLSDRPRVLVIISNPKNLKSYQTPEEGYAFGPIEHPLNRSETKALDALMNDLQTQGLIQGYQILGGALGQPHPDGYPSLGRIRQVLDEAEKAGKPHHVLHFLAHGYLDQKGLGHLILADDNGNALSVAQSEFLNLLPPQHNVRLVVFAACQSDQQALERPLAGLAPSMLQKGVEIPAVIAMQDKISVGAAAKFVQAFYRDLGQHGYLDTALAHARAEVAATYPDEWAIPVLYLQNDNPCLFDSQVSLSARQLTSQLFTTNPVGNFVDREVEIRRFADLLCEQQTPTICWLWGPKQVGKQTLLRQLRFEAYRRGYGHMMAAIRYPLTVGTEAAILYQVLRTMVEDAALHQNAEGRRCLADFLQERAANDSLHGIVTRFLDGLQELDASLERGLLCLFYFYDFAAHENLLSGAPFTELIGATADRYSRGRLNRVRFMVAVGQPQPQSELFPSIPREYFYEEELPGFEGPETIKDLCKSYGFLLQGNQVPARVLELVNQSRLSDPRYYLPGPAAHWLGQLSRRLGSRDVASLQGLQWAAVNGGGG